VIVDNLKLLRSNYPYADVTAEVDVQIAVGVVSQYHSTDDIAWTRLGAGRVGDFTGQFSHWSDPYSDSEHPVVHP
jgi:hypothetical protein